MGNVHGLWSFKAALKVLALRGKWCTFFDFVKFTKIWKLLSFTVRKTPYIEA